MICWDVDNTDVEMAASCWLDIAALVLFVIAAIFTIGLKKNDDNITREMFDRLWS